MADEDVDIWPPPQELKSTLNAWPKVRKFWRKKHGEKRCETLVVQILYQGLYFTQLYWDCNKPLLEFI